ncbi:MAG: hypothetical protein WA738_20195 [Candidatus Angelobacter sp.]
MSIYTPKKIVLNWYQYDVGFSIELIKSFVLGVERQAADSIVDYRNTKKRGAHLGLDEDSWDLQEVFEEYFPTLQRRSALLTVWGFLEHELDALCLLYQSEKGFKLAFSDLAGKGIDRSATYLEKVAGLLGLKSSREWNALKEIQNIRNLIAHNDGRLHDHQGKPKDAIVTCMKKLGFLSGEHELLIAEGFLSKVIDVCDSYFKRIADSIDAAENISRTHRL